MCARYLLGPRDLSPVNYAIGQKRRNSRVCLSFHRCVPSRPVLSFSLPLISFFSSSLLLLLGPPSPSTVRDRTLVFGYVDRESFASQMLRSRRRQRPELCESGLQLPFVKLARNAYRKIRRIFLELCNSQNETKYRTGFLCVPPKQRRQSNISSDCVCLNFLEFSGYFELYFRPR